MITSIDFSFLDGLETYFNDTPYDIGRTKLYSPVDLYVGDYDKTVYKHYLETGKFAKTTREMLGRALHDFNMNRLLKAFLKTKNPRLNVGVMGGHGLLRTDEVYAQIVRLSKRLTEMGFMMVTGGGPGAMEATHLGAWMAGRNDEDVRRALSILGDAPTYSEGDDAWLKTASEVYHRWPQRSGYQSLGIPTWLYGHEPTTPFATNIAKFFDNSIREDAILTVAFGGIIYTPGSAGTLQEIFQEAVQNHYLSFGFASPMVFMGKRFWTEEMPIYPLLEQLMRSGRYQNLILSIHDDGDAIINELVKFRDEKA